MTTEPYLPFYPADYIADTRHLSLEERGAYTDLLWFMWRSDGWLPDDDKKLSMMLGISVGKWQRVKVALLPLFNHSSHGFTQKRLKIELEKAQQKRVQKSSAGTKSAESKKLKNHDTASTDVDSPLQRNVNYARGNLELEPELELTVVSEAKASSPPPTTFPSLADDPQATPKPQAGYPPEFEAFHGTYPRTHCSKSESFRAYKRALAKGVTHDKIINSAREYAEFLKRTGTPAAHATTWLNNERWTVDHRAVSAQRTAAPPEKPSWRSEADRICADIDAGTFGRRD